MAVVPFEENMESSGQNQRKAKTIPAKQLVLPRADINLENESVGTEKG